MALSVEKHADEQLEKSGALTTARIQSLGDNIFGFAMTLLVLNFLVPEGGSAVTTEIASLSFGFLTYAMSFIVLGTMWVSQQNQYHFIERSDRLFLWINIFFLLCVVLVPFSTHLLAFYYYSELAVVLYGLNMIICGLLLYLHWSYATYRRKLVSADLAERIVQVVKFRFLFIISWVSISVAVSLISIPAAFFLFVPAMILSVVPTVIDRVAHRWLS